MDSDRNSDSSVDAPARRRFACGLCPRDFACTASLDEHSWKHHPGVSGIVLPPFKCDLCGKRFGTRDLLGRHRDAEHRDAPPARRGKAPRVKRDVPLAAPPSAGHLFGADGVPVRIDTDDDGRSTCSICSKVYNQLHTLKRHLFRDHGWKHLGEYACSECGERFLDYKNRDVHQVTHAAPVAENRGRADVHIKQQQPGVEKYLCPADGCAHIASSRQYVRRHLIDAHGWVELGVIKCENCDAMLFDKFHLEVHERTCGPRAVKRAAPGDAVTRLSGPPDIHLVPGSKRSLCPVEGCGKTFVKRHGAKHHLLTDHGWAWQGAVPCDACGRLFVNQSHMKTHHAQKHAGVADDGAGLPADDGVGLPADDGDSATDAPPKRRGRPPGERRTYSCAKDGCSCGSSMVFTHVQAWKAHKASVDGIKEYQCPACGKAFSNSSNLGAHRPRCPKRGDAVPSSSESVVFAAIDKSLTFKQFTDVADVADVAADGGAAEAVCDMADSVFDSNTVQQPAPKRFRLDDLGITDIRAPVSSFRHPCPVPGCPHVAESSPALDDHLKGPRHNDIERKYACDEPGCTFKGRFPVNVRVHKQNKHGDDRPFVCEVPGCGHASKTNGDLKKHAAKHVTTYTIPCDKCTNKFKTDRHLQLHKTGVHGVRAFVCDICGAGSRTKVHRDNHVRIHGDARPFACTKCDAVFKQPAPLLIHERRCHADPCACMVCGEVFINAYRLETHTQRCGAARVGSGASKGENELRILFGDMGISYRTECLCLGNGSRRFDFVIDTVSHGPVFVEYDGGFHYRPCARFEDPGAAFLEIAQRDIEKTRGAAAAKTRLMRVSGDSPADALLAQLVADSVRWAVTGVDDDNVISAALWARAAKRQVQHAEPWHVGLAYVFPCTALGTELRCLWESMTPEPDNAMLEDSIRVVLGTLPFEVLCAESPDAVLEPVLDAVFLKFLDDNADMRSVVQLRERHGVAVVSAAAHLSSRVPEAAHSVGGEVSRDQPTEVLPPIVRQPLAPFMGGGVTVMRSAGSGADPAAASKLPPATCWVCGISFAGDARVHDLLLAHVNEVHGTGALVGCAVCDEVFQSLRDKSTHLVHAHPGLFKSSVARSRALRCGLCMCAIGDPCLLFRHFADVHKVPFGWRTLRSCPQCKRRYQDESELQKHVHKCCI